MEMKTAEIGTRVRSEVVSTIGGAISERNASVKLQKKPHAVPE